MYGLSLGVQRIREALPPPVYALLSGLNASTVGIIALAAVKLAEKAITDDMTRILVIFGACAGFCYSALWYFPVLLVSGGLATLLWDGHLRPRLVTFRARRRRESHLDGFAEGAAEVDAVPLEQPSTQSDLIHRRPTSHSSEQPTQSQAEAGADGSTHTRLQASVSNAHTIRIRIGVPIIIVFLGRARRCAD
jgi:hypothetical protein